MAVHFEKGQYDELRRTYRKWWAGELDRPIVPIVTYGHESDVPPVTGPQLSFANAWDFLIDPRTFVDNYDAYMDSLRWHAEAFPMFHTDAFGPGTLAAFLGCTPQGSPNTVWFHPPRKDIPISELHFEFDENYRYYRRVVALFEAAMEKWHGRVVVGMVDLGGVMDVLSSFRGADNLLMDLYDDPEEVLRCIGEIQDMWFLYFDKLNAIMSGEAEGYSHWYGMYHEQPGYILQSDFSYMISPEMFKTFVAPELSTSAQRMYNAVYHLDGIGEIPHLDTILSMNGVKGIQWVPGAGEPERRNWDELLRRILDAGKKVIRLAQKPDGTPIDALADRPGQLYFEPRWLHCGQTDEIRRYSALMGV